MLGLGRTLRMLSTAPTGSGGFPRLQPQVQAWTSSTLDAVVFADLFGLDARPVSRPDAMAVPAVARARHLIAGTISRLPIDVYRGADPVTPPPYWTQGTDGQLGTLPADVLDALALDGQSPHQRMLWTVDDHLFYGESLWAVTDVAVEDGRPRRAVRIPWESWDRVYVEAEGRYAFTDAGGVPLADMLPHGVIYLPGPHEGILTFGQRTIRGAAGLERTAADVAARPFRLELHQETDIELTKAERAELIAAARTALADNHGILFTNAAISTKDHPIAGTGDLLIAGRNASAVDIARDVSMPAAMLDATTAGASLEYATLAGRNAQWLDYGLTLYLDAVAARLSMDDVVPAGQRVAFDTSTLTDLDAPATGAPTRD